MKKSFIFGVLLVALVAGFSACGGKEKSGENNIREFWVGDVRYQITGNNITYLYPKTDRDTWTGLVTMPAAPSKVVLSSGATISPSETTPQNFLAEGGITYTVTAENGDTKTYTVKAEKTPYVPID